MATSSNQHLEVNPRGIPQAPFISNVQEHLGGPDHDVEPTLKKFQETMSKYKFMEMNTAQRRRGLEEKIPDIRKTLQMVEFLKQKKDDPEPIRTTFELNDTLFAKAELEQTDNVHLWLGANVMLSYPLDEAIQLLSSKLAGAEKSLVAAKEDLDFLRDQITTMEVNTARVHNWDVKRRRERREQAEMEGNLGNGVSASSWLFTESSKSGSNVETQKSLCFSTEEMGSSRTNPSNDRESQPTLASSTHKFDPTLPSSEAEEREPQAQEAVKTTRDEAIQTSDETDLIAGSRIQSANIPSESRGRHPRTSQRAQTRNPSEALNVEGATQERSLPSLAPQIQSQPQSVVVPPLNFDMVAKGVYRSGHPNERNFGFLRGLELKSIMYLASDDYRPNMARFAMEEGIRVFHYSVNMNKEPNTEMNAQDVASALSTVLDRRNLPMLIHCNKGKYRVGCLVGILRRLQGWSHTNIFEEYQRFAGSKIADMEFIEVFDLSTVVYDPAYRADWL
ncbi:hypothetical protein IE53DRAFT_384776 [Violaceomyces palustris]|uniref:Uncharacterized protein n=1 Tax=Violaceomyces palustris TaxID=1673888 RepID=A0ACD0P3T8_9BASI|nr:hypothetical protein IE53DRAFT_384776 [Violaceomyces palustris]